MTLRMHSSKLSVSAIDEAHGMFRTRVDCTQRRLALLIVNESVTDNNAVPAIVIGDKLWS